MELGIIIRYVGGSTAVRAFFLHPFGGFYRFYHTIMLRAAKSKSAMLPPGSLLHSNLSDPPLSRALLYISFKCFL